MRRDDRSDADYLRLGRQAAFDPVGRVEFDYGDGDGFFAIGTATLFGRDRLVSAAHVFDPDALFGVVKARINFGRGRVQNIDFRRPGVVNINPRYDPVSLRNDVSVVFLARKFDLVPASLYVGNRIALETPITFVGFGDSGTGLTGSREISTRKRGGENALGQYVQRGSNFEIDFDQPGTATYNSLGGATALSLEGLLGAGDSGGSAWVRRGAQWQLVGINSYGLDWFPRGQGNTIEDDYGDRSGFVYVPNYVSWINSLRKPSFAAATQKPFAVALIAVPEPRPLALVAFAIVAGLIFRRRTRRA